MSFATPAVVIARPDLAVLGKIESISPFRLSDSGSGLFVSDVELVASDKCPGGKDATYYFTVHPEFFTGDFAEKRLPDYAVAAEKTPKGEKSTGKSRFYTYKNNVAQSSFRAFLQAASGSEIVYNDAKDRSGEEVISPILAGLAETFDAFTIAAPPTIEKVHEMIAKTLTNRPVIYVLKQRTNDAGDLEDGYQVDGFYAGTPGGVASVTKSAGSKRRKTPLLLTWAATK